MMPASTKTAMVIAGVGMVLSLVSFFTEDGHIPVQAMYIFIAYPFFAFFLGYAYRIRREEIRLLKALCPPLEIGKK
jgi:hypothetical protein